MIYVSSTSLSYEINPGQYKQLNKYIKNQIELQNSALGGKKWNVPNSVGCEFKVSFQR